MGCLVERYREELRRASPRWRLVRPGGGRLDLVESVLSAEPELGGPARRQRGGDPGVASARSYAYVKISDGCDELCTFCAIPASRARTTRSSAAEILREADACLAEGAQELVLVGQDTARCGGATDWTSPVSSTCLPPTSGSVGCG